MKMDAVSAPAESPVARPDVREVGRVEMEGEQTTERDLVVELNPRLLKNVNLLRKRAQYYVAIGKPECGRQLLEAAIRNGAWLKTGLWWELVATMRHSEDYRGVRALWLDSPVACHSNMSILRAVARAACVSGWHEDSRTLLRMAALVASSETDSSMLSQVRATLVRALGGVSRSKVNGKSRNEEFSRAAGEALVDLHKAFALLDLKAFLVSGTLLGLIREGGIISWDKDIDVGVFSEHCPPDMEDFFLRHECFHLGKVDLTTDRLRLIHSNGTWIDVFPHYREGDKLWHDGSATRWWNTPFGLKTIKFLGVEQYIPDHPERYLEENYGDWRTPVRNFDARIDAPNVEITDQEHYLTLLFFSLESSIRNNSDEKMKRYMQLLRDSGEGGWLDRL